jgi:hypothetical protein
MPRGGKKLRNKKKNGLTKEVRVTNAALDNREFGKLNICRFPGVGFPDQLRCTLKYQESGVSFTSSVTPAAQVFRINSMFDPDLSGGGHQPNGFDQLNVVYGQYCVMASKVRCEIANLGTIPAFVAGCYSDVNLSTIPAEALGEARWSKSFTIGPTTGMGIKNYDFPTLDISNLMGEIGMNSDPNTYTGVGTNPTDPAYFIFKLASMDNVTNANVIVNFTLWFDVWFKELTPFTES